MDKSFYRIILIVGLLIVAMLPLSLLLSPKEKTENMGQVMWASMAAGSAALDITLQGKELKFTPCMVAVGAKAGLEIGLSNLDTIIAEATQADGKLELKGGPVDFSKCMTLSDVPDPWPPTEPDPQMLSTIESAVPAAINVAKAVIEPRIPEEGADCIRGRVAVAMLDALNPLITQSIMDTLKGEVVTSIPDFKVDYSGCGVEAAE